MTSLLFDESFAYWTTSCGQEDVTIQIDSKALPIIPGVLEIAAQNRSGGMNTNKEHFAPGMEFLAGVPEDRRDLIFDPQTSGGLLISVAPEGADETMAKLTKSGIQAVFIGSVITRGDKPLIVG